VPATIAPLSSPSPFANRATHLAENNQQKRSASAALFLSSFTDLVTFEDLSTELMTSSAVPKHLGSHRIKL
jgi:hypothetical protein